MKALVDVIEAASPSWTSDWNVFSIQGTQGMQDVPPSAEGGLDLQPFIWGCGARKHLILIGPDDSIADFRHELVDGQPDHPEGKLQGGVAFSTGQVSDGDCQLESFTQGSHPDPLPLELSRESLLQLLKHLEWYPDEVMVCHRVI